jgi:hypothetical protein
MAITCYKNYGTPPSSTGVPATRTRYALASEIGLLAGHACVLAPLIRRGSKNISGNWRWRMSWSVGCTSWGEVHWLIRDLKKLRRQTRKLHHEPPFHQNLALEYLSFLERQNRRMDERASLVTKEPTERKMDLSVFVFIKKIFERR